MDATVIADKFAQYFSNTYTCNNPARAEALKQEFHSKREKYCGLPVLNDLPFDTELVSTVVLNLKRGKAPDVYGLMAEHLLFCHPIVSVILSKFFRLLMITRYVPRGFKRNYIVRIPKLKDFRSKALTCDDFRGIAISPVLSKVFEYCFLERYQSLLTSSENQFGFKKGLGCSNAIHMLRNIVDGYIKNGSTVNLCAIDISKAFDKVNHYALLIKLMKRNFLAQLLDLIMNLFSGCFSCIKWYTVYSATFSIDFGM